MAQSADLAAYATPDDYPAVLGRNLTYTITVNSAGPDTATNVVVQNTLPKGAIYVSSNPQAVYDPQTGICEWNLGTLQAWYSETLTVTVQVDFPTSGGIMDLYFSGDYNSEGYETLMKIPLPGGPLELIDYFVNTTSVKGIDFLSDNYAIGIDTGVPGIPTGSNPRDGGVYHMFWGWISAGQYLVNPTGLEVDQGDTIYIADPDWVSGTPTGRIVYTHLNDGTQHLLAEGHYLLHPVDLVLVADGGELAVCDLSGKVVLVSLMDGSQHLLTSGGELIEPWGITQDAFGDFIVADRQKGLIRVDRSTGNQTVLLGIGGSSDLTSPNSVHCGFDGRLYVSDDSDKVFIVNATTGNIETTFDGATLSFRRPKGLSVRHYYQNHVQVSSSTPDPYLDNNGFDDLSEVKRYYPLHLKFYSTVSASDVVYIGPPTHVLVDEGVIVSDLVEVGSPEKIIIDELIAVSEIVQLGFPQVLLVNELIHVNEMVQMVLAAQSAQQNQVAVSDQVTLQVKTDPPKVESAFSQSGTFNLVPGSETDDSVTGIRLWFNKRLNDPIGNTDPHDVTNPDNFILVKGTNGFDPLTNNCSDGVIPGDLEIPISSVIYNESGPYATIFLDSDKSLQSGKYRLLVCGSTSLKDESNQKLDGNGDGLSGDDHLIDFDVLLSNLLENPNFDSGLTGWSTQGNYSFSTQDADFFSDTSGSIKGSLQKGDTCIASQCRDLDPNHWYRVRGLVRYNGDQPKSVSILAQVSWYSQPGCAGTSLSQTSLPVITADTGLGWIQFEKTIRPPSLAKSAKFEWKVHSDAATNQIVFGDNLGLIEDQTILQFENFERGVLPVW